MYEVGIQHYLDMLKKEMLKINPEKDDLAHSKQKQLMEFREVLQSRVQYQEHNVYLSRIDEFIEDYEDKCGKRMRGSKNNKQRPFHAVAKEAKEDGRPKKRKGRPKHMLRTPAKPKKDPRRYPPRIPKIPKRAGKSPLVRSESSSSES